jgi:hypothetical protein
MTNITTLTSAALDRLLPTALGFENAFAALDNAAHLLTATQTAFPPVNIVKTGEYTSKMRLKLLLRKTLSKSQAKRQRTTTANIL